MQLRSRILHNEEEEKELEANHGMSQSYFRVKEGNGPSKKSVNKISDISVVEEQVNCDPNPFFNCMISPTLSSLLPFRVWM
jgi:hypothetical protein